MQISLNRYVHPSMDSKRRCLESLSRFYGQIRGRKGEQGKDCFRIKFGWDYRSFMAGFSRLFMAGFSRLFMAGFSSLSVAGFSSSFMSRFIVRFRLEFMVRFVVKSITR